MRADWLRFNGAFRLPEFGGDGWRGGWNLNISCCNTRHSSFQEKVLFELSRSPRRFN